MFKRKYEFKPDKTESGILSKLYITKKQRQSVLKWLLMALVLIVISVIQDVVLSRVQLWGLSLNLMAVSLLTICILQDPEKGSVFIFVASLLYYFTGSTPGPYVIPLLTVLGVVLSILRQCYLYDHFSSIWLCAGLASVLYEAAVFAIGAFLGRTTAARFADTMISGALAFVIIPLFYPAFKAISKMGGATWKD